MGRTIVMSVLALLLILFFPVEAVTQEEQGEEGDGEKLEGFFHGFGFGVLDALEEERQKWSIGHIWLIGRLKLGSFEAMTIIAPEGPPRKLHNLQLTWKPESVAWLNHVTVGKTIPRFGREFNVYRRDLVPTVNYSGITRHMAARDWGVEAGVSVGEFDFIGGAFLGKRTGGNIPEAAGCCDYYLRGEHSPLNNLTVGASWRESSDTDALGADVVWANDATLLSFELIRTQVEGEEHMEWTFLATQKIAGNVRAVLRYDSLEGEKRTTTGLVLGIGEYVEVKVEETFVVSAPDQMLGQLVIRW